MIPLKTLVNNVAAPRLVTYQIQLSSLCVCMQEYTPFSDNMHHLSFSKAHTVDTCDAVGPSWCLESAPQSYSEPWDLAPPFKNKIPDPDSLVSLTCALRFLLSVSPSACSSPFFPQVCIPPLHRSHGQMGLIVVYSLSPFIFTCYFPFLPPFLCFLLSFLVTLLNHLSCGCLCNLHVLSY